MGNIFRYHIPKNPFTKEVLKELHISLTSYNVPEYDKDGKRQMEWRMYNAECNLGRAYDDYIEIATLLIPGSLEAHTYINIYREHIDKRKDEYYKVHTEYDLWLNNEKYRKKHELPTTTTNNELKV